MTLRAARAGTLPDALLQNHAMVAALVQRLLSANPANRPTADELLEHYALLFSAHTTGHASAHDVVAGRHRPGLCCYPNPLPIPNPNPAVALPMGLPAVGAGVGRVGGVGLLHTQGLPRAVRSSSLGLLANPSPTPTTTQVCWREPWARARPPRCGGPAC